VPHPTLSSNPNPDYAGLVQFLLAGFLESPESLRVDCETVPSTLKVWVRVAFEGDERGRVYGRGGRNIHAIRTTLEAIAKIAGQSLHLDIYGGLGQMHESESSSPAAKRSDFKPPSRQMPVRRTPG
jgi:predicted RNA-binding protein YlqC (UPF0109 family)